MKEGHCCYSVMIQIACVARMLVYGILLKRVSRICCMQSLSCSVCRFSSALCMLLVCMFELSVSVKD